MVRDQILQGIGCLSPITTPPLARDACIRRDPYGHLLDISWMSFDPLKSEGIHENKQTATTAHTCNKARGTCGEEEPGDQAMSTPDRHGGLIT